MPDSDLTTDDVTAPTLAGGGKRRWCSCGAPITVWARDGLRFQPVRCRCGRQIWSRDVAAMLAAGDVRLGGRTQ